MISQQTIQQITNRIDILDVVGEFVKLKKRGANYLGNCPFHNEKTPSFTVSPSKEIFKCFGCGKSGNSITFLMEHEKYSYVEALKWLANRYNVEIEETEVSSEVRQLQQAADSLFILNSFAQKYFTEQLTESEEGRNVALSYLEERGFTEEIIRKFQLGYNPESRTAFTGFALQNHYNAEVIQKAGLGVMRYEQLVDNYRGRIIFPIHNNSGKIIGFGARVIGKAINAPKYINTPENELYVKSRILYGSYFARQSIDRKDECLLVEGYTDVISLHQAGIENVVASGGTSLTIDQLRLIKKYTNNLTIIYDGDNAGVKAALRGLDMALEEGLNVKLVLIPDNEDPDSYVAKVGADAFNQFIATQKKDFILFQLEVLLKEAGNDVNRKSEVVNNIAETLSKLSKAEDFTKQQEYIRQCAALMKIDEAGLTNLVNKYRRDKVLKDERKLPHEQPAANPLPQPPQDMGIDLLHGSELQEKSVLRVLIEHGLEPFDDTRTIADYIAAELAQFPIEDEGLAQLYDTYFELYDAHQQPQTKNLLYVDNEVIRKLVVDLTMSRHELSPKWNEKLPQISKTDPADIVKRDVTTSIHYHKLQKIKHMLEVNQQDIEKAPDFETQLKAIRIHGELKKIESELTKDSGTVIVKV